MRYRFHYTPNVGLFMVFATLVLSIALETPIAVSSREAIEVVRLPAASSDARDAEVRTIEDLAEQAALGRQQRLNYFAEKTEPLTPEEIRELLILVGFTGDGLRDAWAVVMKESRGNPAVHNRNADSGDNSYGLFQINMLGSMGPARREQYGLNSNQELFNPVVNAEIALELSHGGTDFGHWGIGPNAYNGGKPRDFPYWLTQYPEEDENV